MAVLFFIPVLLLLLLLLLVFVIKVVPAIASLCSVVTFLYWRSNPENITCSCHLNQRQEFYISKLEDLANFKKIMYE